MAPHELKSLLIKTSREPETITSNEISVKYPTACKGIIVCVCVCVCVCVFMLLQPYKCIESSICLPGEIPRLLSVRVHAEELPQKYI